MEGYIIVGLVIAALGALIGLPIARAERRARTGEDHRQGKLQLREKKERRAHA